MKIVGSFTVALFSVAIFSCGGKESGNLSVVRPTVTASTPAPTPWPIPKNGDYPSTGKVTKINNQLGSVELDHKEIVGVMAPMLMEFYVTNKAMLKGLAVGDEVNFMLRYNDGQEIISMIEKVK